MTEITPATLKAFETFAEVPEAHLQWLIDNSELLHLADDERLFGPGMPVEHMQIVCSGRIGIKIKQGNQYRDLGFMETGDVGGRLPYSRMKGIRADGKANGPSTVLLTHRSKFRDMAQQSEELMQAVVSVMTTRVREFTKQQQQDEKMMSLGKLSAGLAHELNNPASAVVRSAQELKKHISYQPDSFKAVIALRMEPEQVDAANRIIFKKVSQPVPELSMMERSSLEDEIADWLEDHHIEDGYELADVLADYATSMEDLDELNAAVPDSHLAPIIGWVRSVLTTEKMVAEIESASKRIADLVQSIKSYTHMDRAPEKELADIHSGVRNTVTMLNHKIKKNQIQLVENFAEDLPQVKHFVSEMNQVWTNLIDNAIDAMETGGTLQLESEQDGNFVKLKVIDSGCGIPEDVLGQIFDPFFTTKGVGEGTGMGLEIAHRIVVNQHNGKISVDSIPGRTEFEVCLPIQTN